MIRYDSEAKIHPLDDPPVMRQAYVALLRKIADDVENTQVALPGIIFAELEGSPASDHCWLSMRCFHSRNEVHQMIELLTI